MRPAHWARVASALRRRYNLTWIEAKAAYRKLRKRLDRTPSLRTVSLLPLAKPRWVRPPTPRAPVAVRGTRKSGTGIPPPPPKPDIRKPVEIRPGIQLAPRPAPRAVAVEVPRKQFPRNLFEMKLAKAKLPVQIARTGTEKAAVRAWRNKGIIDRLVKELKIAFKQVQRRGYMGEVIKKKIFGTLRKLIGEEGALGAWHQYLKNLYGPTPA